MDKSIYKRPPVSSVGSAAGLYDFMAVIEDYASLGANKWKYAWSQVNDGNFTEMDEGDFGTLETDYALNDYEHINSASGTLGIGIHTDDLDTIEATFTVQPIPVGMPVWMRRRQTSGGITHRFAAVNGLRGECKA